MNVGVDDLLPRSRIKILLNSARASRLKISFGFFKFRTQRVAVVSKTIAA